jgi:hypothetical protein
MNYRSTIRCGLRSTLVPLHPHPKITARLLGLASMFDGTRQGANAA